MRAKKQCSTFKIAKNLLSLMALDKMPEFVADRKG